MLHSWNNLIAQALAIISVMMAVIDEKVGTEMFAHQLHDFAHANLAFLVHLNMFIVIW